jgi:hypothetical protein
MSSNSLSSYIIYICRRRNPSVGFLSFPYR